MCVCLGIRVVKLDRVRPVVAAVVAVARAEVRRAKVPRWRCEWLALPLSCPYERTHATHRNASFSHNVRFAPLFVDVQRRAATSSYPFVGEVFSRINMPRSKLPSARCAVLLARALSPAAVEAIKHTHLVTHKCNSR